MSIEQPQYQVGQVVNGHRWTGSAWEQVVVPDSDRSAILNGAVADAVRHGWRAESISPTLAVMAKGKTKKTNHLLHLILTILTLGFWLFIWIPVSIGDSMHKVKRMTLQVAPDGTVIRS